MAAQLGRALDVLGAAIALLATFGLAVVAVVSAAGDDDAPGPPFDVDRPGPDEPSGDDLSEAGQDRPQPVS